MRVALWAALVMAALIPVALAATSPYLAYRGAAYVMGGFAGILALSVLLVQPVLAGRLLPITPARARRWHRRLGSLLIAAVVLHVTGLFIASPPDALDALLLVSPTPFSVYGVIAMWSVFATVLLVAYRRRFSRPRLWRGIHNGLALMIVVGTVVHAVQIEGTMEPVSKWLICLACLAVTALALWRTWAPRAKSA